MKKTVIVALLVLAVHANADEVVGRVDGVRIVKKNNGYEILPFPPVSKRKESKEHKIKLNNKRIEPSVQNPYKAIVEDMEKGAGEPVYSRLNGFDVERVLDKGNYFGAVISGKVNEEELRKAFKYVEKKGTKYYVAGEWK